jgi:hypothetical protein
LPPPPLLSLGKKSKKVSQESKLAQEQFFMCLDRGNRLKVSGRN